MDFVKADLRDYVMTITLDRPDARNAFNQQMAKELESVLDLFDENPEARVGILRSESDVFCAGQDLKEASKGKLAIAEKRGGFGIMSMPPGKPLIAAIEGQALAGGFELALSCDLMVAARNALFGLPEAKLGLVAIGGGCFRLPKRLPYHLAMEMILTARPRGAEELHRHGLINILAETGGAYDASLSLARTIAENGPLAVRASKQIVLHSLADNWSDSESWAKQMEYFTPVVTSQDYAEGLRAFAEKRSPIWAGR